VSIFREYVEEGPKVEEDSSQKRLIVEKPKMVEKEN
jgi:hypothetical protein